jgi:hypothetical protein
MFTTFNYLYWFPILIFTYSFKIATTFKFKIATVWVHTCQNPEGYKEMSSIFALVFQSKCGGMGWGAVAGSQLMSTAVHIT